jgi:hypothetical protein
MFPLSVDYEHAEIRDARGFCVAEGCCEHWKLEEIVKRANVPHDPDTLKITKANCTTRLDNTITTILDCWEDWQDYARQEAEESDDTEAYDKALAAQLNAVLTGMLFDEE